MESAEHDNNSPATPEAYDLGYLVQRLARAFARRPILCEWGVLYRLCETGPVKLDPRLVRNAIAELGDSNRAPRRLYPGLYADPTIEQEEQVADAAEKALAAAAGIQSHLDTADDPGPLAEALNVTAVRVRTTHTRLIAGDVTITCPSIVGGLRRQPRVLVWILNDSEWVYPDDWRLWTLLEECLIDGRRLLVVARKIAPLTFVLFKQLGVRGAQFYSIPCSTSDIVPLNALADRLGLPHLASMRELRRHAVHRQIQENARALRDEPPTSQMRETILDGISRGFADPAHAAAHGLIDWAATHELVMPRIWTNRVAAWQRASDNGLSPSERPTDATTEVRRSRVAAEVDRATWNEILRRRQPG